MKIYTKTGDKGTTSLYDGVRVSKSDIRIHTLGTLDEFNSQLGLAVSFLKDTEVIQELIEVQNLIFSIGSFIALDGSKPMEKLMNIDWVKITSQIESRIDAYTSDLPPLTNFIIPGGRTAVAQIHGARSAARKLERFLIELEFEKKELIIKYVNRLSDFLFTISRVVASRLGDEERYWILPSS